jgi:hypothetical protein
LRLEIRDERGTGASLAGLSVLLFQDDEGIGPIEANAQRIFDDGYRIPLTQFAPPGQWRMQVSGQRKNAYDAIGTFMLSIPQDVAGAPTSRDFFENMLLLAAMLILCLGFLLWHFSSRRLRSLPLRSDKIVEDDSFTPLHVSFALFFGLVMLVFMGYSSESHIHGRLQALCTEEGGTWQEYVPMRAGQAISNASALGCTVGKGNTLRHFTDAREFEYFRKSESL